MRTCTQTKVLKKLLVFLVARGSVCYLREASGIYTLSMQQGFILLSVFIQNLGLMARGRL